MTTRRIIATTLATIAASVTVPAAAQAACADPAVRISTPASTVTAGSAVTYAFGFCHDTDGAKYTVTVQERAAQPGPDGTYDWTTVSGSYREVALDGTPGEQSGDGTFTPARAGRYRVVVEYFRTGANTWEKHGEVIIRATQPPAPTVTAQPDPTPVTPDAPAETPVATPVTAPVTPAAPAGDVAPEQALITLAKTAVRKTVKAGNVATFRLRVRNASTVAARNVVVCDRLPARTQYVGASRPARFQGAKACFAIGTLSAGQAKAFTLRLRIDTGTRGTVKNIATATADNAPTVTARATVNVPRSKTPRVKAPVTG